MEENANTSKSYRSTKSFGERYEYIAISELLKRGHDVYKTLVDDQGIDCIIRKSNNSKPCYVDLQIKARSKNIKNPTLFAGMKIEEPRENYVFLFFSEKEGTFWIIPSKDLVNVASRNEKGKNKGKYSINLSNEKFKDYEGEDGFKKLDEVFETLFKDD